MTISDRLRTWVLRGMVKAANLPVPWVPEWRRVQYLTPTFRALCAEGVRANGIVFNCVSAITFAYPEPKLRVYRETGNGLELLPNHPLQMLLNRPNPQMGQAELLQYIALFKSVGGNCYLYKVRSKARRVVELMPLNDSQITPVAGADLPVSHYLWTDEETGKEIKIPAEDMVHLKWLPDPLAPWRGIAPLMAVAREVDTDSEARKYLFTLLKNDAVPRLVVTLPPGSKPLSNEEHELLTIKWQEKHGGDKRGLPFIAGGGMDVKRVGLDLHELAFEALSRVPEARIAGAFRLPPVMAYLNVGLEQLTYNNAAGMRRLFTEDCLTPLWRMDADEIGSDLLPEFGGAEGLVVKFDTSEVVALQEAVKEKFDRIDAGVRGGYLTVAQAQAQLGVPVDPQGDYYLRTFTIQAVPFGAPPEATLAPVPEPVKALPPGRTESKAKEDRRKVMIALIAAQRQNRATVAGRMEGALDNYFGGLADRVIHRALRSEQPKGLSLKALRSDDLLPESEGEELVKLVRRFYVELLQLSWDTWNLELGVTTAFDLTDPAVTRALEGAGARVQAIQETTRQKLQEALQFGNERGWSIDHLVRGDSELGRPGLRDLVEQTYKGRAQTIARTELGNAQQTASANRYAAFGVDRVLVMDNGFDDSAPQCVVLGNGGEGTIMPLSWALSHPLGHPRCVRGWGAAFPDDGPIDEAAYQAWQAVGGDSAAIGGPGRPDTTPRPKPPKPTTEPGPKPKPPSRDALSETEQSIRNNMTESAHVYDADGNMLFSQQGTDKQITFSDEQLGQMKGATVTHNHPNGTPFSPTDIQMAHANGLREIRAVNSTHQYSWKIPEGNNVTWDNMAARHQEILAARTEILKPLVQRGRLTVDEAAIEAMHATWARLSREFKTTYTRTEWAL